MTGIIRTLQTAINALAPTGKTDLFFELFFHVNPTTSNLQITELLTWTGHDPYTPVTTQHFAEFFRLYLVPNVTGLPAQQLWELQTVLEQNLTNLKIYHIGANPEQTYIIGEDAEGNFAGLKLLFSIT